MKIIAIMIYLSAFLLSRMSFASECRDLSVELDAMKKAQTQIMQSLVSNHEGFSENISDIVNDISASSGRVSKSTLQSLKKTAKAYRVRSERAEQIASKLDFSTEDLIKRVKKCLK